MASGAGHHRASMRAERPLPSTRCNGGGGGGNLPIRPKSASATRRSVTVGHHVRASLDEDNDSGRVRVSVRLRPKSPEDCQFDSDFTDCVELQPELKRVKLRKNNWSSESYKFDEVFSESASQKRVYDAVAKPVVESVLEGYNGTVMAYGQTGTGKTYTVGRLGKDDPSERGIMVRALEDIFASTISGCDVVSISYLQLYLESVQDLLAPEKINIPIVDDQKTGEVSLPGSAIVEIRDLDHFLELLQIGETNRYAANTKLNTESSRSHAILMVHIQRSLKVKEENDISSLPNNTNSNISSRHVPHVLRSKLLIVDLAGSERIDKSGSEGHMLEETKFINLSLTSLGKCINALAENSPHIPTRDSKLTRLLRDSFGGTARTSLIVTIGPSGRHYSETASTIMFGQRAMKIVNAVKLREEVDYESLCKKLENHVDYLTSETDRQQKLREIEKEQMEKKIKQYETSLTETKTTFSLEIKHSENEKNQLELENRSLLKQLEIQKCEKDKLSQRIVQLETSLEQNKLELENSAHQKVVADKTELYEKKIAELLKQLESEHSRCANLEEKLSAMRQYMTDNTRSSQTHDKVIDELKREILRLNEDAARSAQLLEAKNIELISEKECLLGELTAVQEKLLHEETQRKCLEGEVVKLKQVLSDEVMERESKRPNNTDGLFRPSSPLGGSSMNNSKYKPRGTIVGHRDTITKIFEEVGLSNILALLKSEDVAVQTHAVKVVANLAAEDINQERIVKEGGLDALLVLLESADDTTVRRVTSGAVANLAMNGINQELIMNQGGTKLLAELTSKTDDPQTLRMVAGALANLCGNEKLHVRFKNDGGIKALLGMTRSGHDEVIAQVARGFANLAKCESRGISQGYRKGSSLLIEDGALSWMVNNSATFSASTRRHIELALCHLAQNEYNTSDIIASGGIKELVRISHESTREDIRNLAKKSLNSNPAFSAEIKKG